MEHKEQYRRKLPHIQPEDAMLFITFRLMGTLPKHIIQALIENKQSAISMSAKGSQMAKQVAEAYNSELEQILDSANYGPVWLKQNEIANVVAESLHYHDGRSFKLVCYCIMSNHVHFIAYKFTKPVYAIMNTLKTYTAKECNKLLDRKGRFWQREYYDRIIRDRNDFDQKIKYVLNNPVAAHLVNSWQLFKWNYCRSEFAEK